MNRIEKKFKELKKRRKAAFIAYITAGDPTLAMTGRIIPELEANGVDIIELGIPFSDPIADGPTIQAASQRALKGKVSLRKIFNLVERVRKNTDIPIVFMTYYNPVLKYGITGFFKNCRKYGVDGVIIPDLPCEEAKEVVTYGRTSGVATIFLAAPTSTLKRINDIAMLSRGFIYYVSLTGVTGARRKLPKEVTSKIRLIRSVTDKSVAVGFGISNAKQAGELARIADGVIVGSAIVKIVGAKQAVIKRVAAFSKNLARAIHNA